MNDSDTYFPALTEDEAGQLLAAAGLAIPAGRITLEKRDERWLAHLPQDRVAWFAMSAVGRTRLLNERQTLKAIARVCTFRVPKVALEGDGWEVRDVVPGLVDPWRILGQVRQDKQYARRIGEFTAAVLIEQHMRIARADLAVTLPDTPNWPPPRAWVMERLPDVTGDKAMVGRIGALFDEYEALSVEDHDRVLVHGDLGLHNCAYDPDTLLPRGIFDYNDAAWADRHLDFRYTILDIAGEPLFEAALADYERALGRTLERRRIFLYNALCAAGFLAFRRGIAPETNWCGRTLEGDLEWTANAIRRLTH